MAKTSAQLWSGDRIAQVKGAILGAAVTPNTTSEISVSLPLVQLNQRQVLVPVIWWIRVFLGINATGVEDSVVLMRLGTTKDGSTNAGDVNKNYDDPTTLVIDEHILQGTTSGLAEYKMGTYYDFPKGVLAPTGQAWFYVANQAASAQNLSGGSGFSVGYTVLPLDSAEILQSVVTTGGG